MNQNVVYVSAAAGNVSREARRVCKEAAGIVRNSSNKLHIDSAHTSSLSFSLPPGDTCRRCIASRVNASVIRAQNKRYRHRPARQELAEETTRFHPPLPRTGAREPRKREMGRCKLILISRR